MRGVPSRRPGVAVPFRARPPSSCSPGKLAPSGGGGGDGVNDFAWCSAFAVRAIRFASVGK